jgi:hypothetical protein
MSAQSIEDLRGCVGHKIVCVAYGDPTDPDNVALKCI